MYAVIETGGKQYKVAVGDRLKVEKLAVAEGASVELGRVLMVAEGERVTLGSPTPEAAVSATVLGHGRGDKIRVFKMKRRKNYRRTQGHRQSYTEIEITAIGAGKPVAKAKAKTETIAKTKTDTKADAKAGVKAGAKAETKAETKADTKASAKAGAKTVKKAGKKTGKTVGKKTGKTTAKKK